MKHIEYSIIIGLFICLSGCVDLNEDLTGQPTQDKFFKTATDFKSFINGAYTPLIKIYGEDAPYVATAGGEDITTNVPRWKGFATINIKEVSNPDEVTNILFNGFYTTISSCNTLLQIIKENTVVPANELKPIEGEARFLRAFSYFNLVRWFGDLPLITEDNQVNAAKEPQSTIAQIYDFIIEDLKISETVLPEQQKDASVPTRWSAKALLAKVYLFSAGYPLQKSEHYVLARDKAGEVIDQNQNSDQSLNQYGLETNFYDLWIWNNRYINKEFMFALYASADNGTGGYVNRAVRPEDSREGGWGDFTSDSAFYAKFPKENDARVKGTFYLTMRDGKDWKETRLKQPYVGKLRDGGLRSGGYAGPPLANKADGFYCMLRYAELLLIYAEAANMAEGSPSEKAYWAINEVRQRAGLIELSGLSKDDFDKKVLDERNWELAFECNRWFDLCRRELFEAVYPTITVEKYKYLLPKPYEQLGIMQGLRQNQGY